MVSIAPPPQGLYLPAKRHGDLIFVSGMTPRQEGILMFTGKVDAGSDMDRLRAATEMATQNSLSAARAQLEPGEALNSPISLTVYVNADPSYTAHSKVADFASALLASQFGGDIPSRAAIGVASLPGDAPVEVSTIFSVGKSAPGA